MIDHRSLDPTFEPDKDVRRLFDRAIHPPLRDLRFWGVQALAIAVAGVIWMLQATHQFDVWRFPSFLPISLFVVPVVYAALNFGLAGSLATAAWTVLLTLPVLIGHMERPYLWAEACQFLVVAFVALFVGDRVEREVIARRAAEAVGAALRQLFAASPAPTILVSEHGLILQINAAALRLFGYRDESEAPATLEGLVGTDRARSITADGTSPLLIPGPDGGRVLQPIAAAWGLAEQSGMQVMFFDVSEEHHRANRADAYAAWVLRGQEEERQRIAKEIHDEPIQSLIHLCRQLDAAMEDDGASDRLREQLADLRALATGITEDLRRLSKGLRPPSLDDLGLPAAVRRIVSDLGRRQGIEVELRVEGDRARLGRDLELGLFRIAQEALNNVEKHAEATRASVRLSFARREVRLEVVDDGRGFNAAGDWTRSGSLGLLGMQERATLLGGHLRVVTAPGRGTRIVATLPVMTAAAGTPLGVGARVE